MISKLAHNLPSARRGFTAIAARAFWADVPMGPPDPILGITEAFKKDPNPKKVLLGTGAYRDGAGKPYILPSVREAEKRNLEANSDHEYAGIAGIQEYIDLSLKFAYGDDSAPLKEKRVAAVQTLSGTGACRLAGEYINRFHPQKDIYLPAPTWGNHIPIMKDAGLKVTHYKYYHPETCGLDFDGMMGDIESAPKGSTFLLHACAHNPTGVDPTPSQWADISAVMKEKAHLAFFDCAYQGFASGDAAKDATAFRQFVADGHLLMLGQSFAKNFGLYGERIGTFSVVCQDPDEAQRVQSQLKILIRPMYSNPPVYGARVVKTILADGQLAQQWSGECKGMADRIMDMRAKLRGKLEELEAGGAGRSWSHITDQIGMFCFSGLKKEEVIALKEKHSIYFTLDGRISMAGVTDSNVDYVAKGIADVL